MNIEYFYEKDANGNPIMKDSKGNLVYTSEDGKLYYTDSNGDTVYLEDDSNLSHVYTKEYGAERFYLSGAGTSINPGGATMIGDKNSDLNIVWGHIEISPEAVSYNNQLVNVIYVSDSGETVTATPTLIQSAYMTGATFKNHTSMFVTDSLYASDEHTFKTTGDGIMTYYIGGINEGTWTVTINNIEVGKYEATIDGKMISFQGETGTVVLTPSNTRPAGTSAIRYNLDGGKLPEGAPTYYYHNEVTVLPIPEKTGATFEGWYTSKDFKEQLTVITEDMMDTVTLYAKWSAPIIDVDYTTGGTVSDHGGVTYSPDGGGIFKVINGEEKYLVWSDSDSNGTSIIGKDGRYSIYAADSLKVSFILTFARNGDEPLLPFSMYLRDTKTPDGKNRFLNIFKMDASGKFFFGSTQVDQLASVGPTTVRFVLDFEKGKMLAYNENGDCLAEVQMDSVGIKVPAEYSSSYADWFQNLSGSGSSLITMKASAAGSIRVYGIKIVSGNVSESCKNFGPTSSTHTWDNGVIIRPVSTTDCMPGLIRYTCLACSITKESALVSDIPHSNMSHSIVNGNSTYACGKCGCEFSPKSGYFADGTTYDGIIGAGNGKDYITLEGTNQPVINNKGQYELINDTGNRGALELWIPSMGGGLNGFSSANNSLGFVSFKVNALTEENINFYLVDTNTGAPRWSSEWCITDAFLSIGSPVTVNGRTYVTIKGWDGAVLKTIELTSGADFTGWIDIKACIELDPDEDTITLHYYVDGQYVDSLSKELTTSTDAINSVVITGHTSKVGSGLKLDDIAFGFTPNGVWEVSAED